MMGIEIREAVEDDALALHRFMTSLVAERLPVVYARSASPSESEEREFIRSLRASPNSVLLVATSGTEIVGILDFHGHPKPQAAHGGQLGMSVAREHRGRGIGRAR